MQGVKIDILDSYSEKAYKATQGEKSFFIPKSVVVGVKEGCVFIEDWFKFDDKEIEIEEVSLFEIMENKEPKDKHLTGVEYKYNPKCFEVQNEAISFCVARKFALVNLWTGAGKTFIYLGIIDALGTDKNVIVCPVNLRKQLGGEIQKHFPHLQEKIKLVSYTELSSDKELDIDTIDVLIFDEVHRVKNSIAMNSPKLTDKALELARKASFVYGGSATPSPNGSHDLLGVMYVLHRDFREYTHSTIKRSYCKVYKNRVCGIKNLIDFCEEVSPYVFYRNRDDFEDIPYEEIDYPIHLTELEKMLYKASWEDFRNREPHTNIFKKMAVMKKLMYEHTDGGGTKRDKLLDVVAGIEGQAIIFVDTVSTENNELEQVAKSLGIDNCAFMVGNRKNLDSFIEGKKRFLITSYGSGSEGLNLQFCSDIIFYGHNFNYMTRSQAYGRIRRYGQEKVCRYHNIYYSNSVEGSYMNSLARKQSIAEEYEEAFNKKNYEDSILLGGE